MSEDTNVLLDVENLHTSFFTENGEVKAVNGISFKLEKGKTLGIVGESGSGKSVTAYSIMQILAETGRVTEGKVLFKGDNILEYSESEMQKFRGEKISIIFQDPMTSLNPVFTVGYQLEEAVLLHTNKTKAEAKARAIEMLTLVGVNEPESRVKQYPHELSGGMRQRAMIALAMAVNPKLLIADEPTTALDVTIQAQILDLIKDIQKQYDTSVIMITHDLGVVANIADDIAVMYAGKIMEYGHAEDIFEHPAHTYTWGVLQSIPPEDTSNREPLHPILGTPPDLFNPPAGCPFAARCPYAMKVCSTMYPPAYSQQGENHYASCWLYHKKAVRTVNPITEREVAKHE